MVALTMKQIPSRRRQKGFGDHQKFLARVTKTLHYGKYPKSDCTSLPVTELAAEIFSRAKNKLSLELLDVEEAARLSRTASVSPCSLVLALLYLDRLKASNPKYLAKVPPSQLFIISLMVGSKFLQDDGQEDEVNTCEWATYAGMTIQDINRAEKEFLHAIDWELFVSEKLFWRRLEGMERLVGLREGCKRGWFSYTDMDLLLPTCQYSEFIRHLANIMIVCVASYTTTVFAILGSTILISQIPGFVPTPMSNVVPHIPQDSHSTSLIPTQNISEEPVESFDSSIRFARPGCFNSYLFNSTDDCNDFEEERDLSVRNEYSGNEWAEPSIADISSAWTEIIRRFIIEDNLPRLVLPAQRSIHV